MEGLKVGFLHKALFCSLPLLLLLPMLAFPNLETCMPEMWQPLSRFLEAPAFAFLLLNCVIFTIFASSKLESDHRGGQEEKTMRESMSPIERGDGMGAFVGENAPWQSHNSTTKYAYDCMNEGEYFLRSGHSLHANYANKINREPSNLYVGNEEEPTRRARLACRRSEKGGLIHSNKPQKVSNLEEKKLMRGSLPCNDSEGSHARELFDIVAEKSLKRVGHAGNMIDHPPRKAPKSDAAAVTAQPSLEEVWAAIKLSNKSRYDRMQADKRCNDVPLLPAAARAELSLVPQLCHAAPAAAAAGANSTRGANAALHTSGARAEAQAGSMVKHKQADEEKKDRELEELNRRAEEFIARFNEQMRVQRQESLKRQKGLRLCNHDVHRHVQLPVRGVVVG